MSRLSPGPLFLPIARAVGQLGDPIIRGVLIRSIAWSIACFVALHVLTVWMIHRTLGPHNWMASLADILGWIAASTLTLWLFVPVATAIGAIYIERIALCVERRFYPSLPVANGAPAVAQVWDGIVVGLKILALNLVALVAALLLPGIGLILGWMIASYAIGRGLFVAVAMRRMPRPVAERLYRSTRAMVLAQGAVLALIAYIPVANLFVPLVGVAAMVHVLDLALTAAQSSGCQSIRNRIDVDNDNRLLFSGDTPCYAVLSFLFGRVSCLNVEELTTHQSRQ